MAAVTPKFKFGLTLVSGNPNLREFSEGSTQSFNAGDLVKLSSGKVVQFTTPSDATATTTTSAGIWGVAAKDAVGTANSAIPVYVISPEQEWEIHVKQGVKPSTKATYDEGKNVKLAYSASTSYTLSDGNSNTVKTTVGAWFASSSAASAGKGAIVVAYKTGDEGTKGGRILVRFGRLAADAGY